MAILDTEKVDFLWKKIIFGVTKTAGALVKFGSNETIASPAPVLPSSVWKDGDDIPAEPAVSAIVLDHTGSSRIRATTDPTSPANQTWLATSTFGDVDSRLTAFIPPTFGSGYAVKVFVGDPQAGGTRIFPDTTNEEFVFDYSAGVLIFTGNIPAGVAASGIYLELYRYGGATGVGSTIGGLDSLSDVEMGSAGPQEDDVLTYKDGVWQPLPATGGSGPGGGELGTMSLQDADDVDITGGSIANVTLTNVTIDAGEF